MELNELIRQHGQSVAFVFKKMGIASPVTTKDVTLIALLYGDVFINALQHQISIDENGYSGFGDGPSPDGSAGAGGGSSSDYNWIDYSSAADEQQYAPAVTKPVTVTPTAKKATSGLLNILSTVAQGLGAYAGSRSAAIQKNQASIYGDAALLAPQPAKPNSFLIMALVLIAVLVVVLMASKHKK